MRILFRPLCQNILHLGTGELLGRLCNVAIVILLGHRYGVVILGAYALAQSVTQYLQPLIDFGLRHVGARLVALYPEVARDIVERVQRRRLLMAGLALPLVLMYAACVKLPAELKLFLFSFSAVGALYAISLDWAAWGRERLHMVGFAKSAVPLSILIFLVFGRPLGAGVLWYAVAGNAFGFVLQGAMGWVWWRRQAGRPDTGVIGGISDGRTHGATLDAVRQALAWRHTSAMGLAWLCYLAFNTVDMLMLGLMSNPEQVGLYGAAYRILNQVLATYYLLTQVLYPQFARQDSRDRAKMLRARILVPLLAAGTAIAAAMAISRRMVLTLVFGPQFLGAGPLLLLLAWCIPLDFMTSYLSNAFIAWGMTKKILSCTGIGAASNILLNLLLIPAQGARGAALSTLLSYAIFLLALYWAGSTSQELAARDRSAMEAVVCPR